MGITLEIAQNHLDEWLKAELVVTGGQSYQIGSRRLDRANLYQIREEIKYWENKVNQLRLQANRGGKVRVMRAVPRDL